MARWLGRLLGIAAASWFIVAPGHVAFAVGLPPVSSGTWGTSGEGAGEFDGPWGIAVSPVSGDVYVADTGNDRIQEFTATGAFVRQWGTRGTGPGQLVGPRGIAIDGSGNVYVADDTRVQEFTATGSLVTSWSATLDALAINRASGAVYGADLWHSQVRQYTATGAFVRQWAASYPSGVAVDQTDGEVYVVGENEDEAGERAYLDRFTATGAPTGSTSFTVNAAPEGLAVSPDGSRVYFTTAADQRVHAFTGDLVYVTTWGGSGSGAGQFSWPRAVAVAGSGAIYVAERGRVQVFQPSVTVPNLSGVTSLDVGYEHACAVVPGGQVRCWGANEFGQLGDGTTTDRSRPTVVLNASGTGPLTGVTQVSLGQGHTCARLATGEVRCWGVNARGQLGDGSTTNRSRPVSVATASGLLTGVSQVSAGAGHTCARLTNTEVRCWGDNYWGQLGDTTTTDRRRPVAVAAASGSGHLTRVAQVAAGYAHTCARLSSGEARCWGAGSYGQLGDGNSYLTKGPEYIRKRPVTVVSPSGTAPLTGVAQIVGSTDLEDHTCARLTSGQARCWGPGGANGDGTDYMRVRPVAVKNTAGTAALGGVAWLGTGSEHACAVLTNGKARCWGGSNQQGGLGTGDGIVHRLPATVLASSDRGALTGLSRIAGGGYFSCALTNTSEVRCWGSNSRGQLGSGTQARYWYFRVEV